MGIMRLLLALAVVALHAGAIFGLTFVGGQTAVQSFYIISGFYMSLILNEKYIGVNSSYKLFISNRLMRLYPVYWAVLIATVLVCVGVSVMTKGQTMPKFEYYQSVYPNVFSFAYLILTNLFIFGQDVVMFLGITPASGHLFFTGNFLNTNPPLHAFLFIPQAWTLGLELTFYLFAPFILKRGLKVVFVLIGLSLLLRFYLYNSLGLQNDSWSYRFFPTELMFFLFGYLCYRIYLRIKKNPLSKAFNVSVLLLMVAFTISYQFLPDTKLSFFPFAYKDVVYFMAIIFAVPVLFNFLKKSKWDSQIGELSYPVYVTHMLVIMVGKNLPLSVFKSGWFIALLTVIAAFLLNKFIALPLEKYRQARVKILPVTETKIIAAESNSLANPV